MNYVDGQLTGERWQCVEFVRRFLILARGVTFDDIDNAYDIWSLSSFRRLDGSRVPIIKIKKIQHIKNMYPDKGDILVWNAKVDAKGYGHVAIVMDIDRKGNIFLADQNWDNEVCTGQTYSRIIRIENEPHIIGWIRLFT